MKVRSKKPKGQRIFKSHTRPLWIEPIDNNWWFNLTKGIWQNSEDYELGDGRTSSYYSMRSSGYRNVYSLKTAKRLINKWNMKGITFYVGMPWIGYNFTITKR